VVSEKFGCSIELLDNEDADVMLSHPFMFTLLMRGDDTPAVRPFEFHPQRSTLTHEDQVRAAAAPLVPDLAAEYATALRVTHNFLL
jgi:hypothetical protein